MATEPILQAESALAELADQFAQWRQSRRAHEPIPPRLWSQAVALTALLPYSQVAKRLRLSPADLKKRCLARPGMDRADSAPPPPDFIEVTELALGGRSASRAFLIEVERPDGTRLRLHYPDTPPVAMVLRAVLEPV